MITKNNISTALFTMAVLCVLGATGCESARKVGRDPLLGQTRLAPPQTEPRSVYVDRRNSVESGVVPGSELAAGPTTRQTNYPAFPDAECSEIVAESYETRFSYDKIVPRGSSFAPATPAPQRFTPYEQERRTLLSEFQKETPTRQEPARTWEPQNTLESQNTSQPQNTLQPRNALQPSTPSGAVGHEVRPVGEIRSDVPPAPDVLPPMRRAPRQNPEVEPGLLYFHLLPE